MERKNVSARWLLPLIQAAGVDFTSEKVKNTYLTSDDGPTDFSEFLIEFTNEVPDEVTASPRFKHCSDTAGSGSVCTFASADVSGEIAKIAEGRYSQIDPEFAKKYYGDRHRANMQIIRKDKCVYDWWENRGVVIPRTQEAWDIPNTSKETFKHEFYG